MSSRRPLLLPVLCAAALLAGCSRANGDAALTAFGADEGGAVAAAAEASASSHPLCTLATLAEVRAVAGAGISRVDVIDDPSASDVSCIYLDPADPYSGVTLRHVSTGRLRSSGSAWRNAEAYVNEWSRGGTPVDGLGDGAAWIAMPPGLLLRRGDSAVHLSASRADFGDGETRARFETLARQIASRLP